MPTVLPAITGETFVPYILTAAGQGHMPPGILLMQIHNTGREDLWAVKLNSDAAVVLLCVDNVSSSWGVSFAIFCDTVC